MSKTESFESVMEAAMPLLSGDCVFECCHDEHDDCMHCAIHMAERLKRAHDREIRDVSQQEYHRGFEDGAHSMDAEHRAIAMRLRHLPLDGRSHENLSQIARAIYHADWGWTKGACAALRDELVRLMGGVSGPTCADVAKELMDTIIKESDERLQNDGKAEIPSITEASDELSEPLKTINLNDGYNHFLKTGDDNDACNSQCGGACAADCGGGSGEHAEVSDGRVADDCGGDTGGSYRGLSVHMDGLTAYDVLDNERHKAVCALRRWKPEKAINNDHCGEIQIRLLYQLLDLGGAMMMDGADAAKKVRDRLIHLLGGDQPSGIDVMREMDEREAKGRITDELRELVDNNWPIEIDDARILRETEGSVPNSLLLIADRIDERVKHDRESDQLRIVKLVEKRDELRLIIADVVEERDHWKELADTNTNALLRIGSENVSLKAECKRLRKRLDSITEAIEHIKSIGQE